VEARDGDDAVFVEIDDPLGSRSSADLIDCGDGDDTVLSPGNQATNWTLGTSSSTVRTSAA